MVLPNIDDNYSKYIAAVVNLIFSPPTLLY